MSPFVAAVALPFALSTTLYAAAIRSPALQKGGVWPGVCAASGFLAGYIALEGWPPLVPVAAKQKFFAIAIGSLAIPAFTSALRSARFSSASTGEAGAPGVRFGTAAATFWAVVAVGWIGIRRLGELETLLGCALLIGGAGVAMISLARLDRRGASSAAAPIIALGAGFAAVALHGASASLSLLAAAAAASAGAIGLVAAAAELLGGGRTRLGPVATSVFVIVLMAIAATLVWFTPKTNLWALGVAALAPVTGALATQLPIQIAGRVRALIDPLVVLLFASVPVGIAVLLASRSAPLE